MNKFFHYSIQDPGLGWEPSSFNHGHHHNRHLISKHIFKPIYIAGSKHGSKNIISKHHTEKPVIPKHHGSNHNPWVSKKGSKNTISKHHTGKPVIQKHHGSNQNPWGHTKPLVRKKHKIIVYANKNVGECSKSTKIVACWKQQKCIKYIFRHGGYSRSCFQRAVQRMCNLVTLETCKFCTKYYLKTCQKFHHHHGHHGIIKCNKRSHDMMTCNRQINKRSFQYNKICLLYTSPSPRDQRGSRMPSSA